MVNLENKVLVLPNICGIEIDATNQSTLLPTVKPSLQPFTNTVIQNSQAKITYTTPGSIKLREQGKQSREGILYSQQIQFSFPNNDPLRVERLKQYVKAKYIYIKLNSGMVMLFGRNDYFQNTKPKIAISANEKQVQITIAAQSITPLGFTNGSEAFDFPPGLPINLYNL